MTLAPYRDEVLRRARTRASSLRAEARATVAEILDRARSDAEAAVARARVEGEAAADARLGGARLEARRRRRERVLALRRALLDEARAGAVQGALALRGEPLYPRLLEGLGRLAREQLGEGAELEVDPPLLGGVRGRHGRRSVDYTLPAVAGRCLDRMGDEVERLWS